MSSKTWMICSHPTGFCSPAQRRVTIARPTSHVKAVSTSLKSYSIFPETVPHNTKQMEQISFFLVLYGPCCDVHAVTTKNSSGSINLFFQWYSPCRPFKTWPITFTFPFVIFFSVNIVVAPPKTKWMEENKNRSPKNFCCCLHGLDLFIYSRYNVKRNKIKWYNKQTHIDGVVDVDITVHRSASAWACSPVWKINRAHNVLCATFWLRTDGPCDI